MKHIIIFFVSCISQLVSLGLVAQNKVEYDLHINDTIVNYTGKNKKAIAINGQIPAPTLRFTEGDTVVIHIHNHMAVPTSLHWHGILVPNRFDGVPYLTSAPVMPGTSVTYRFPIEQNGTYWYHSHTGLQEQMGLYGAFIIDKRKNDKHRRQTDSLPEQTIIFGDWTDTNPMEINRRLHTANDWAAIKKGSVQSYGEAIHKGHFMTKLKSEWKRMSAMDVSDIYYDKLLSNGLPELSLPEAKPGKPVKLRIINGGASTYFWLRYAGGKIKIVAADGQDVVPIEVDRMLVAVSETYDIVLTVPEHGAAELQATAEDRNKHTSVWLGSGDRQTLEPLPKLDYFAGMKMMNNMMKMNGDVTDMGMKMGLQKMDMNKVMYPELQSKTMSMPSHSEHRPLQMNMNKNMDKSMNMGENMNKKDVKQLVTLNYDMFRSPYKTTLSGAAFRELKFELTGNMDRYVWTMDNKTISESDKIPVKEGENIRIILHNNTMMRHPMHLHGHFFRLVNSHGEYSPLKFTFDIMPAETDTIEFKAGERSRGDWFFHCHILYHMMSGMGRVVSYQDSPPNPQIPDPAKAIKEVYRGDKMFYLSAQNDFSFSGNKGRAYYSNTRWAIQGEWQLGYKAEKGYDIGLRAGRYVGRMQWLMSFAGIEWTKHKYGENNIFGQKRKAGSRLVGTAGVQYTLPMLFVTEARINTDGNVRLQLEREDIPVTNRLRAGLMLNSDKEYYVGLNYIITPWLGISASYNSELKWGAGIRLNY
jgi:CopA family copper-resistance protein